MSVYKEEGAITSSGHSAAGGSPLTQIWFGLRLSNGNAAISTARTHTEVLCTALLLLTAELLNRIILLNRFLLAEPILTSEQIVSAEQQQLLLLSQDVHLWLEHHLHKEVAGKHLKDQLHGIVSHFRGLQSEIM